MNRKKFISNGLVAGLSLPLFLSSKAVAGPREPGAPAVEDNFEIKDDDLTEATVDMLQQKMQNNEFSSEAITGWYLNRIQNLDKAGPVLNSVIEVNPDALSIAKAMDEERKAGKVRGPLHGIPILIKDNINSADKMMTTAGSLALSGNHPAADAFIVTKLREAGAVLLGKTNLSEFANFRSTHSTSAWSSRGGQTKCPYVLNRNPSGSSSGTGTAVAANLCAAAIGTETDGSIVSPASVNGIVGIKPTVGLWSRSGIIPISATQDTAGPMCRTVTDAAILLSALVGIDPADKITGQGRGKTYKDYTQFLKADALKGKRLGIEKSFLTNGNPDVVALLTKTIVLLKEQGAIIVEVEILQPIYKIAPAEGIILHYEFKDGLNKYLATANTALKTLGDIIEYNKKHEAEVMPYFKQEILVNANKKGALSTKEYREALAKSLSSRKMINDLMKLHQLDAICGTTNGLPCCIDIVNGDYDTGFSLSTPAAMAGVPHITIPMGFVHELPIGFSFFGKAYSEPQMIALGYAFEQATKARRQPKYLPSV